MVKVFCDSCGFQNEEDSEFCANCGNVLEGVKKSTVKVEPTVKEKSTFKAKPVAKPTAVPTTKAVVKDKLIPYLGDSIDLNEQAKNPKSIGCGAFNTSGDFYFNFQQRNHLKVVIHEEFDEERIMDGLRTIMIPDIKKEDISKKEILDIYINTPFIHEEQIEHYPLIQYSGSQPIDFGNLVIKAPTIEFEDQIGNVIPITSTISYNDALKSIIPADQKKIIIKWDDLEELFANSPTIKHHLYKLGDDEVFRWTIPISLKVEVEHPIISILKNFDIYNSDNWKIIKEIKKVQEDLDYELIENFGLDFEIIDRYMNVFGIGSSIVDSNRLATLKITLTNITYQQVFNSDLLNTSMILKFFNVHKELIQPSALKISKKKGEYLLKENHIYWELPSPFKPGPDWEITIELKLDWDILTRMQELFIVIGGEFKENPQILDSYIYCTPTGFPVGIKRDPKTKEKTQVIWNPGNFIGGDRPIFKPSMDIIQELKESQPVFLQQTTVSIGNLQKDPTSYSEILEKSNQYIESLLRNIKAISKSNRGGKKE